MRPARCRSGGRGGAALARGLAVGAAAAGGTACNTPVTGAATAGDPTELAILEAAARSGADVRAGRRSRPARLFRFDRRPAHA